MVKGRLTKQDEPTARYTHYRQLKEARESGSLLEASEVANVVIFMLTRPRGMTIRDVVMLPTNFDL
jgi:ribitol 2-dehydrogenase